MGQGADDMDMEWARAVPVRAPWPTKDETIAELVEVLERIAGFKGPYSFPFPEQDPDYGSFAVVEARVTLAKIKEPQT